jgi:hypothetical protein
MARSMRVWNHGIISGRHDWAMALSFDPGSAVYRFACVPDACPKHEGPRRTRRSRRPNNETTAPHRLRAMARRRKRRADIKTSWNRVEVLYQLLSFRAVGRNAANEVDALSREWLSLRSRSTSPGLLDGACTGVRRVVVPSCRRVLPPISYYQPQNNRESMSQRTRL